MSYGDRRKVKQNFGGYVEVRGGVGISLTAIYALYIFPPASFIWKAFREFSLWELKGNR